MQSCQSPCTNYFLLEIPRIKSLFCCESHEKYPNVWSLWQRTREDVVLFGRLIQKKSCKYFTWGRGTELQNVTLSMLLWLCWFIHDIFPENCFIIFKFSDDILNTSYGIRESMFFFLLFHKKNSKTGNQQTFLLDHFILQKIYFLKYA